MTIDLIQNIYRVFSKYYLRDRVTACYCGVCMTEAFSDHLHKIPLKEITADTLNSYIDCVGIEEDGCNDFRYFFPRILELLYHGVENENAISDFYIFIWSTLERIDYSKWNENEQRAFLDFFKVYWDKVKQPGDMDLTVLTIERVKNIVLKPFC